MGGIDRFGECCIDWNLRCGDVSKKRLCEGLKQTHGLKGMMFLGFSSWACEVLRVIQGGVRRIAFV